MNVDFGILKGTNALQYAREGYALGETMRDRKKMREDEERANALSNKLAEFMRDPNFDLASSTEFTQLAQINPELAQAQMGQFQSLSKKRQNQYIQDMVKARDAFAMGDPNTALGILGERIERVTKDGGTPTDSIRAFQIAQTNPEYFVQGVDNMIQATQGITTSTKPQEAKVGRFKTIDTGNSIELFDSATGKTIKTIPKTQDAKKELEIEKKQLEFEAQKKEQADQKLSAIDTTFSALKEAELLANSDLSSVSGSGFGNMFTFSGQSQDLQNAALNLQSMLTVDNLKLMSGVLTDKDIALLSRVGSGLNLDENGYILGSEEQTKKRIGDIYRKLDNAYNTEAKKLLVGKNSAGLGRKTTEKDVDEALKYARENGLSIREVFEIMGIE